MNIALTQGQQMAMKKIHDFLDKDTEIFILKGYAGTGKTTLIKSLYLDLRNHPGSMQFYDMLMDWMDKSEALRSGQITQDEYDAWRYHYPTPGQTTHSHFEEVPAQE